MKQLILGLASITIAYSTYADSYSSSTHSTSHSSSFSTSFSVQPHFDPTLVVNEVKRYSNNAGYNSSNNNNGYYSSNDNSGYSSSIDNQNQPNNYSSSRTINLMWVTLDANEHIPAYAIVGGQQPGYTQYVCRGRYANGMHPGKLIAGKCNIGWGGREIELSHYQVLVSKQQLGWVSADHGRIPAGAIVGGYENSVTLYICQARYQGGWHSGKVIGDACNIGWGHREIRLPYYNVLVA